MDADTLQLLLVGFGGGMAWMHLTYRIKGLGKKVSEISENHLPHIHETICNLPCHGLRDCPLTPDP